ncbi:MAG: hypothetical protein LC130_25505 [Bryobacterales bacterium]|nr:hypothetical protein [Bryobacterales bacterium]
MTKLVYLYPNQAFVFMFGDALLRLEDEPMFYQTRPEAVAAAERHHLTVWAAGALASYSGDGDAVTVA